MNITINFDMDGTIADLYGVENWLGYLEAEDTTPYEVAKPMLRLASLAKRLNTLARKGYTINIISWTSKCGSPEYNARVAQAKRMWLNQHLPSVCFKNIYIIPYGTPKENYCTSPLDILFDDEEKNRTNWQGVAFDEQNILEILSQFN